MHDEVNDIRRKRSILLFLFSEERRKNYGRLEAKKDSCLETILSVTSTLYIALRDFYCQ